MANERLRELELAGLRARLMSCERALILQRNRGFMAEYQVKYHVDECRCTIPLDFPTPDPSCTFCDGWGVV